MCIYACVYTCIHIHMYTHISASGTLIVDNYLHAPWLADSGPGPAAFEAMGVLAGMAPLDLQRAAQLRQVFQKALVQEQWLQEYGYEIDK